MENRRMLKLAACSLACTALIGLSQTGVNAETKKGWYGVNNGKYNYYDENGQMVKNKRINIGGKDYSFDADGNWLEEIYSNSGKDYSEQYKKSDPSWENKNDNWYYSFHENDKRADNKKDYDKDAWDFINGYYYHFNKDGVMEKNVTIKDQANNDCILNSDGALINREAPVLTLSVDRTKSNQFKEIDGKIYLISLKGDKFKGWEQIKNNWFYFNKEGVMQKDTTIIENGKSYKLDINGVWIK